MANIETLIKILSIKGIGRKTARLLIEKLPPGIITDNQLIDYLLLFSSNKSRLSLGLETIKAGINKGSRTITDSKKSDISFIEFNSVYYPTLLSKIDDPPLILSYKGDIEILKNSCIGIVGVRNPTSKGYHDSYYYGKELAQLGCTIVSGLAKGCDTFAHKGCIEANGKAIAVLANPLDTIYPFENKWLSEEILNKGGLLISESFLGQKLTAGTFLQRNRIQVGLCDAVVVIEANNSGGTMETIKLCLKNNRKVGCLVNGDRSRKNGAALYPSAKVQQLHNKGEVFQFLKEKSF